MDAAKDIRRILKKREATAKQEKKERDRVLAAVCCVLCVVTLGMGIAMMRSLDRLQYVEKELMAMQSSYAILAEDFAGTKIQQVFAEQVTEEKEEKTNRKYVVEGGDSLGYISRKFYGDNSGIYAIMDMNGLENADMIYEGQVLWIPAE